MIESAAAADRDLVLTKINETLESHEPQISFPDEAAKLLCLNIAADTIGQQTLAVTRSEDFEPARKRSSTTIVCLSREAEDTITRLHGVFIRFFNFTNQTPIGLSAVRALDPSAVTYSLACINHTDASFRASFGTYFNDLPYSLFKKVEKELDAILDSDVLPQTKTCILASYEGIFNSILDEKIANVLRKHRPSLRFPDQHTEYLYRRMVADIIGIDSLVSPSFFGDDEPIINTSTAAQLFTLSAEAQITIRSVYEVSRQFFSLHFPLCGIKNEIWEPAFAQSTTTKFSPFTEAIMGNCLTEKEFFDRYRSYLAKLPAQALWHICNELLMIHRQTEGADSTHAAIAYLRVLKNLSGIPFPIPEEISETTIDETLLYLLSTEVVAENEKSLSRVVEVAFSGTGEAMQGVFSRPYGIPLFKLAVTLFERLSADAWPNKVACVASASKYVCKDLADRITESLKKCDDEKHWPLEELICFLGRPQYITSDGIEHDYSFVARIPLSERSDIVQDIVSLACSSDREGRDKLCDELRKSPYPERRDLAMLVEAIDFIVNPQLVLTADDLQKFENSSESEESTDIDL